MHFRTIALLSLLQLCTLGIFSHAVAEPVPEAWKKTMTGDPATNFFLKKYSEKSEKPAVQYYRNMYLIALLSGCGTLDIRLKTFFEYEKAIGFDGFSEKDIKDAKFEAGRFGSDMDVKTAAHLCAGGDYMFGAKGVLVPGVLRPNGLALDIKYDPANPYIRLDIDKIEGAFNNNRK